MIPKFLSNRKYRKSPFLQIFIRLFPYICFSTPILSIAMSTIKHGSIANKTDFCNPNFLKIPWTVDFWRKNSIFRISRAVLNIFSAWKKNSSEIKLGHILSIANKHLCAIKLGKAMMKYRENEKNKTVFPVYFQYFRPEKYVFRKSG